MKFFIAITILAALSIVGARLTFLNRRLPLGFRSILLTGTEYIFIGLLLGEAGMGILDKATLQLHDPFLILGLTWIGFMFGLQFERRQLKKILTHIFFIAFTQSLITYILVTGVTYLMLSHFAVFNGLTAFLIAQILGSAASCTAQSALAIVSRSERLSNPPLLDLLRYVSGLDGLFALGFFTLTVILFPAQILVLDWMVFQRLVLLILIGLLPAIVLITLIRVRFSQQELILFLIGVILFAGGGAHTLDLPPILAGFICGVITANLSRHRLRAMSLLLQAEKSIYIILLILLGASWHPQIDIAILAGVGYFIVRLLGKVLGMFLATRIWNPGRNYPGSLGVGLISEGGFSVAIIISFRLQYPSSADAIVTIIILSVFLSELIAPGAIVNLFKRLELRIGKK